jgi:hypothetical protein
MVETTGRRAQQMDVRPTRSDKPTTAAPALKTTEGLENRRCIISRKEPSNIIGLPLNTPCFHFFDRVASGREGVRHTSIKTRSRTKGARLLDRARVTVVKSGSVTENRFHQLRLVYFASCAHHTNKQTTVSSHCNFSGVHHLLWRSSQDTFQYLASHVRGYLGRPTRLGLVHLSDKCAKPLHNQM